MVSHHTWTVLLIGLFVFSGRERSEAGATPGWKTLIGAKVSLVFVLCWHLFEISPSHLRYRCTLRNRVFFAELGSANLTSRNSISKSLLQKRALTKWTLLIDLRIRQWVLIADYLKDVSTRRYPRHWFWVCRQPSDANGTPIKQRNPHSAWLDKTRRLSLGTDLWIFCRMGTVFHNHWQVMS